MIKNFIDFISLFGFHYKLRVSILLLSCIFAGSLETMGVILIFPFMMVLKEPSIATDWPVLRDIFIFFEFSSPKPIIYLVAIAIGLTFVLKNIYMIFHNYLEFGFIMRWKNNVRKMLMEHYLTLPLSFHLRKSSSSLMSTLNNDVNYAFNENILQIVLLLSNIMILITLSLLILYFLFIPAVIAGGILFFLIYLQLSFVRQFSDKIQHKIIKTQERNLHTLQRGVLAIKETKVFLKENASIDELKENDKDVSHQERMQSFMYYMPPHITEIILIMTIVCMTCLIIFLEGQEGQSLSYLAILAITSFRIAPLINRIAYSYGQIRSSSEVLAKLHNEISEINYLSDPFPAVKPLDFKNTLSLKKIGFSYSKDGKKILNNVSLNITKGQFLGIIGPSGAGKSTLVDIILGLLIPTSGTVHLDDRKISADNRRSYLANISYVPQSPFISNATLAENIAFGEKLQEINYDRVNECLKAVGLLEHFIALPEKLNTTLGENGNNISGGQRQRIAIARALYYNTEILVLDEATSALDMETEKIITSLIRELSTKKTIIFIAHRLATLKNCDRIFYMEEGKLEAQGTFDELYKSDKRVKRLIDLSQIKLKFSDDNL